MIIVPHTPAVIASSKKKSAETGQYIRTLQPTLLGPHDISLKLTVAVVSGFLLGDVILISSLSSVHK